MTTELVTTTKQLWERWPYLSHEQRLRQFRELPTGEKADYFLALNAHIQRALLLDLPQEQQHVWMRLLAQDDAADVIQEAGPERRDELLALLDEPTRKEVVALLAYKEDEAGALMNPRFARLRPELTVDAAIHSAALRSKSSERVRPVCGDSGRRDRISDLLFHRKSHHAESLRGLRAPTLAISRMARDMGIISLGLVRQGSVAELRAKTAVLGGRKY